VFLLSVAPKAATYVSGQVAKVVAKPLTQISLFAAPIIEPYVSSAVSYVTGTRQQTLGDLPIIGHRLPIGQDVTATKVLAEGLRAFGAFGLPYTIAKSGIVGFRQPAPRIETFTTPQIGRSSIAGVADLRRAFTQAGIPQQSIDRDLTRSERLQRLHQGVGQFFTSQITKADVATRDERARIGDITDQLRKLPREIETSFRSFDARATAEKQFLAAQGFTLATFTAAKARLRETRPAQASRAVLTAARTRFTSLKERLGREPTQQESLDDAYDRMSIEKLEAVVHQDVIARDQTVAGTEDASRATRGVAVGARAVARTQELLRISSEALLRKLGI